MTTSQLVAQHVPYLRRYARVLTGNQASGDSYVAATLEALVKEPNLVALAEHPRIALYQVFSRIWNSVQVNGGVELAVNLVPAERHLGQITAMPRQAFLLVSVEGFSEEDAPRFSTLINKRCRIWSMSPDESLPPRLLPTFSLSKTRF